MQAIELRILLQSDAAQARAFAIGHVCQLSPETLE
jgi:hypothetical protein